MYSYSTEIWIIFFFIYSFIGWLYEEIFFLIKEKKLVNRGFMHGPFLPIYGVGAILILFAVMPVSDKWLLVFIFGGAAATLLELFTGLAMQWLFHVRYWDYTGYFMNYKGHICLFATVVWCIASVLLVNFVQIPLGNFLTGLNSKVVYFVAHIFSICFAADFALSFREAMDFRKILDTLTADNEELARIVAELNAKKAEIEAAVKEFEAKKEQFEADISEIKDKVEFGIEKMKFNTESNVEALMMKAEVKAEKFKAKAEERADRFRQQTELFNEESNRLKEYLEEHKQRMRIHMRSIDYSSNFDRIRLILERNNIAAVESHKKALEQLKEQIKKHIKD